MKKFKLKNEYETLRTNNHFSMFQMFKNKTKQEQIILRSKLIINPIKFTLSINGDDYIAKIIDFARNGRHIITNKGIIKWSDKKQRYTKAYYWVYFSFLNEKRNPHI